MISDPGSEIARRVCSNETRSRRAGVEHEYQIADLRGPVHFGQLISRGHLDGRRLDPGDPNAFRQSWGGVITADGAEAEVVTPPVTWAPGSAERLRDLAATGAGELRSQLARSFPDASATGYSTHLNFEVDDVESVRVARRLALRFSPVLALLIDRQTSPGLLIRPRYGRVEVGGEYLVGDQLCVAATFGAAAASACLSPFAWTGSVPPAVRVRSQRDDQRFGWYTSRHAFGGDLYAAGRDARLLTSRGRRTAGALLEDAWTRIRPHAETFSSAHELELVDRTVDGDLPIPLELSCADPVVRHSSETPAHGQVVTVLDHERYQLRALHATWESTVFELTGAGTPTVINVPDRLLAMFLDAQRSGSIDDLLDAIASGGPLQATLSEFDQTRDIGVYDSLSDPAVITPPERDVMTGRSSGGGGSQARRGKHQQSVPDPHQVPAPALRPHSQRAKMLAATGVIAMIAVALTFAVVSGDDSVDNATSDSTKSTPAPNSTAPSPTGGGNTPASTEPSGTIAGPGTSTATARSETGFPMTGYTVDGQTQPIDSSVTQEIVVRCTAAGCSILGPVIDNNFDGVPDVSNELPFTGTNASGTVGICAAGAVSKSTVDIEFGGFVLEGQAKVPTTATGRIAVGDCPNGRSEVVYEGTTSILIDKPVGADNP